MIFTPVCKLNQDNAALPGMLCVEILVTLRSGERFCLSSKSGFSHFSLNRSLQLVNNSV